MPEAGILEARNSFSALIERVEKGEEITITRHGKAVAKIVPTDPPRDVEKARAAVAAIREMRKKVKPDPDGLTIRDYIEMGRRY
ncbi:type II toxin-antitoxin system Phd/YefM family antitoxin [Mesorhizobium sp. J428]|uniref:type II toxin-antitoxin system Phd/YefM family antitoxin n=1 Tax=Mesorhizobium sp. J428 TaxID=2898440 RepID=UPI002150899E|nr:type II toxin-antitoxin system prevent-host-death family antitoxin [Mesorhizobium sp. J428]MCR5855638.1 type II toxin-antitoxin system prevent-host-death family antitoxin [Mesorhizobium sp. J428]